MRENTPADQGFFLPPEWRRHERAWLSWPCRAETWRDRYDNVCNEFAGIIRAIAAFEPVTVLTPGALVAAVRLQLGQDVEVIEAAAADSWLRDTGPTFLIAENGAGAGVCWGFNGWGNKLHDIKGDIDVARDVVAAAECRLFEETMVLEGGAIDVDAVGTLLSTESVLLNDNRNPTLDVRQIEERLVLMLGAAKVIWLRTGLTGDNRDGQVATLARFACPGRVLCAAPSSADDGDAADMAENRARLAAESDSLGRSFEIIDVPTPAPRRDSAGRRLPLTYLSFYLANGAVILPAFDDPQDGVAQELFRDLYPQRKITPVPVPELTAVGGGLRGVVLPQPARIGA